MNEYQFAIKFIAFSILDGSEYWMSINDYIEASTEEAAIKKFKKKCEIDNYYQGIVQRIKSIKFRLWRPFPYEAEDNFISIYERDQFQMNLFGDGVE